MSGLEPNYTNIIQQELEIGDLRRTVALVTGKLERLQQFVDRSEWGQERERLNARITELERDIEACQRSNAELLVCGAQNCEPYRDLQSQLAELTQGRNEAQQERVVKLREQLEAQSVTYQDNLTEIQLLKAHVVSREKEIDVMMRQRNLAEAQLLVLERREAGYLSELDDYARTVLTLRSRVNACEAEHGLHRVHP